MSLVGLYTDKKVNDELKGDSIASAGFFSVRELLKSRPQQGKDSRMSAHSLPATHCQHFYL